MSGLVSTILAGGAIGILLIALAGGLTALAAAIFAWAWSVAIVPLFGLPVLTFWQALAATVLLGFIGHHLGGRYRE